MLNTFQNSASVLSIGFFFTLITLGLASALPHALFSGPHRPGGAGLGRPFHLAPARRSGASSPHSSGINPIHELLGPHLLAQPGVHATYLTGTSFFPNLIAGPFGKGLRLAFIMAAAMCFLGAVFSWFRGPGQTTQMQSVAEEVEEGLAEVGDVAMAEVGAGSPGSYFEPESPGTAGGS